MIWNKILIATCELKSFTQILPFAHGSNVAHKNAWGPFAYMD